MTQRSPSETQALAWDHLRYEIEMVAGLVWRMSRQHALLVSMADDASALQRELLDVSGRNADIEALLAAADSFKGPGVLVPSRNWELLRWCLENGLRVAHPMTLMTMGLYNEPVGAYLPSILY